MSAGDVRCDPGREPAGRCVRTHRRVSGGVLARDAPTASAAGTQRTAAATHAPAQPATSHGRPQSQWATQQHTSGYVAEAGGQVQQL